MSYFKKNLSIFTKENIETIEKLTIGQSENEHRFEYRKCLITESKAHEIATKMTKVEKGGGGIVNIWFLNQKISGLVFVKPNTPALKYGRDTELEAAKTFIEFIKGNHKDIKLTLKRLGRGGEEGEGRVQFDPPLWFFKKCIF